jgi:hypothetical protein
MPEPTNWLNATHEASMPASITSRSIGPVPSPTVHTRVSPGAQPRGMIAKNSPSEPVVPPLKPALAHGSGARADPPQPAPASPATTSTAASART